MGMGDENPWDLHGIMEMLIPGGSFVVPYGITTPAQQFAMVATRHMWETGTTSEHLGHVCMTFYDACDPGTRRRFSTASIDDGGVPGVALHRHPVPAPRLLRRDRRGERDDRHLRRRAQDCATTPVYVMGVSARNGVPHANQYAMRTSPTSAASTPRRRSSAWRE